MSTRAERRKRVAVRVAAGELPARRVTHFQGSDIRSAVQEELAEKRKMLAAQRERARLKNWSFTPPAAAPLDHTPIHTRRP